MTHVERASWLNRVLRGSETAREEQAIRKLSRQKAPRGFQRIYHYHIRKTGGTSLVKMFHALSGREPHDVYQQLIDAKPRRIVVNDYVFSGWERPLIEQGNYFYAFSHLPMHRLKLPKKTFTLTCFRDPVRRVISHYRMLLDIQASPGPKHPCFKNEGPWLGDSFEDFLDRVPREHLCNQLFMFSKGFEISEALDHVSRLSQVMFLEEFERGIGELNRKTKLVLTTQHQRKSGSRFEPSARSLDRLRELLADEYAFLTKLRNHMGMSDLYQTTSKAA